MNEPLISLKGLDFSYSSKRPVIKGLDFDLHAGQRFSRCAATLPGSALLFKCAST